MNSVQWIVCSEQWSVCSVQCAVCSVQCAVNSVQCSVCSVQCAVFSVQNILYSVQLTVWRIFCAVCSAHSNVSYAAIWYLPGVEHCGTDGHVLVQQHLCTGVVRLPAAISMKMDLEPKQLRGLPIELFAISYERCVYLRYEHWTLYIVHRTLYRFKDVHTCMYTRLLDPQHLDGIWIGQDQYSE